MFISVRNIYIGKRCDMWNKDETVLKANNPPFTQSSNQAGQQFHPPIPRSIPNKPTL